ncbi:hypothetical protein INH39_19475 [Massilia violaceinigra]|uniref:FXSXX-COOH protein n=1 Tax=Massilia violaceinigra TaxID=2045208 RepID=A0ABY3ZZ02_9BURK|nr:hypothetical protein [Massilia violaceinigra]UOD27681.1 hypothetical protein INH39_19475 [Massilia violaceinigra]
MTKPVNADSIQQKPQSTETAGRIFSVSLQEIPRVSADSRARLEAAARRPATARRNFPTIITD